ncbi:MAG: hypothetical protein COB22_05795 [Cycloclasticus sp.]|nr:MAG: hypothetical protein COB22_05795 [Cycloclasticus sp.]
MINIKHVVLIFCLLTLTASVFAAKATKSDAEESIQSAQQLWDKSIAVGHEWNTVKPLVAQAKQAMETNDFAAAVALANRAAEQAELSLVQAEHEKTNWVNNLPK